MRINFFQHRISRTFCKLPSSSEDLCFDQPLHNLASISTLSTLLRRCGKCKSLPDGRRVHDHLTRHGYDHITFLGNCLVEMYGSCGSVQDTQAVFDKIFRPNLYSWNILINAYGQNGNLEYAQAIFDLTPNPDLYSWNILIKAYRQNGTLDDMRSVFARMPYHNAVSWTALIAAFAQDGHGKEALDLFHQMQFEGVEPDKLTFVRVLDASSSLSALQEGLKIHVAIVDSRFEGDIDVGTALVNMYGKCGRPHHASSVFGKMSQRDTISWTAIIAAFAQNGHGKEALHFFHQMQVEGVEPDNITFVCVLDAFASLSVLQEGKEIHVAIVQAGYEQDMVVGTSLVNMYGKCRSFQDTKSVFGSISFRSVVSWNAMIAVSVQNGYGKEAISHFHNMRLEVIEPDKITFISLLDACANLAAIKQGQELHTMIINIGYEHDVVVQNALISMYGKSGNLCSARHIFDKMSCRDAIAWNVMISLYVWNGHGQEALDLFCQMHKAHVEPDNITFAYALDACAKIAALKKGQEIHAAIVESGFEQDMLNGTALVKMYGNCGSTHDASRVFVRIPYQDVISWTAMIGVYAQNGHGKKALNLFWKMNHDGIEPDKITFVCVLDSCASLAAIEGGQEIHVAILDRGCEGDVLVGNALINMYGKCGSLQNARSVFENMLHQDIASWNAMIGAFAHNGHGSEALGFFHRMQYENVIPDGITFTCILSACSHTGQIDDGRRFFYSMNRDYGIAYTQDHYVSMVDLVGRAGNLDEAEDLVSSMPVEEAAVAWLSLLNACRIHGDLKRAVWITNQCIKLDPRNAAPYVMLSNIFAAANRWAQVALVRKALKQHSCTSIDCNNVGEVFRCAEV